MPFFYFFVIALFSLLSCAGNDGTQPSGFSHITSSKQKESKQAPQNTIKDRFPPPQPYQRMPMERSSFAYYLRHLPLQPKGAKVHYYNGATKPSGNVYAAVIDLPIGNKNLHQCADAVMRLRAEYLYQQERYDEIHFNFTNGFQVDYSKWRQGYRVQVDDNRAHWQKRTDAANTDQVFRQYLETIFTYAGTLSLEQELDPVVVEDLKIGDVFIQGGSPGHAIILVDVAQDPEGRKVFLLAQSYMPAQELQLLKNPNNPELSPWYSAEFGQKLVTPEWTFDKTDLKRFPDE